MDLDFELTQPERLLIIAVCAGILLLVFLIMVCKLSPFCCLHPFCPIRATYHDQDDRTYLTKKSGDLVADHPHFWGPLESHKGGLSSDSDNRSTISDFSEMSLLTVPTGRWNKDYHSLALRKTNSDASSVDSADLLADPISQAEVELCIRWDKDLEVLNVQIAQLRGLPGKLAACKREINVKIQLLEHKIMQDTVEELPEDLVEKCLRKEVRTEVKKRAPLVQFDEKFIFPITEDSLEEHCLRVLMFETDKLSHMDSKGEVVVPIAKTGDGIERNMVLPLKFLPKESQGEMMVSLMYLPTSEKLFITLVECKSLKNLKKAPDSELQVKVSLIYGGSRRERRRSKTHKASPDAILTETLSFDVPQRHIGDISILLMMQQLVFDGDGDASENESCYLIGKTLVGLNVESTEAHMHWIEMLNKPRNQVAHWHTLY